jgi:hypothetical protein
MPAKDSEATLDQQAAAATDARLGVPADEVALWIESWGTARPLPMPTPRKAP